MIKKKRLLKLTMQRQLPCRNLPQLLRNKPPNLMPHVKQNRQPLKKHSPKPPSKAPRPPRNKPLNPMPRVKQNRLPLKKHSLRPPSKAPRQLKNKPLRLNQLSHKPHQKPSAVKKQQNRPPRSLPALKIPVQLQLMSAQLQRRSKKLRQLKKRLKNQLKQLSRSQPLTTIQLQQCKPNQTLRLSQTTKTMKQPFRHPRPKNRRQKSMIAV